MPELTDLDGSEQITMFNETEGKRASVATLARYVGENIVVPDKIYGAKWSKASNLPSRTKDAAEITTTTTNFCHKGSINANYNNPFDKIYPWSAIEDVNVDMAKYRSGNYTLEQCVSAVFGDADFTYFGSNNLFVGTYIPEFWYRSTVDSSGNIEYFVSPVQRMGFDHHEAEIRGKGFAVDAGDSKVTAGAGIPLTNIQVQEIHSRAKASGFTLTDIRHLDAVTILFIVEYANMNVQDAIGSGCCSCYREDSADTIANVDNTGDVTKFTVTDSALSSLLYKGTQLDFGTSVGATTYKGIVANVTVSGTTYTVTLDRKLSSLANGHYMSVHGFASCEFPYIGQSLGNMSGYIGTNEKANAYYRGMVLFGNRYAYTLGIYRQQTSNKLWLCPLTKDPDDYDALNTSDHVDSGTALPTLTSAAWVTVGNTAQRIAGLAAFMATGTSNGSSASPVGDQQYVPLPSAGNTILLAGGYAGVGWVCGLFCGNWTNAASRSWWNSAAVPLLKNPQ